MKKRFLICTIAACLAFSMTACGKSDDLTTTERVIDTEIKIPDRSNSKYDASIFASDNDATETETTEEFTTETETTEDTASVEDGKTPFSNGPLDPQFDLEVKDGFGSNTELKIGNLSVLVPDYYKSVVDGENGQYQYVSKDDGNSIFMIMEQDGQETTKDFIHEGRDSYVSAFLTSSTFNGLNAAELDVAGYPALEIDFSGTGLLDGAMGRCYVVFDNDSKKMVAFVLLQTKDATFNYFPDFEKIISNIKVVQ